MFNGFKIIDADSHAMEPNDLWDKYLDRKYRPWAPGGPRSVRPLHVDLSKEGYSRRPADGKPAPPYIQDGKGGLQTYAQAYREYIAQGFTAKAYRLYLQATGIDRVVIYPTVALGMTARQGFGGHQIMGPDVAAALCRAYNSWLHDFCSEGDGVVLGAGGVDLRDADAAAHEARRCVIELGLKALFVLPQPALGIPLHDPYYDTLWGTVQELGVPLGIHGLQGSSTIGREYWGNWRMGTAATDFPMEEMLACLSFTAGGILERFPKLKVVFLESSAGWAPSWLWWCDDKWKQFAGGRADTKEMPSFYFKRQCYISGEPDEPGYGYCAQFGLEDNVMTATDFPHPEDVHFPHVLQDFFEVQPKLLTKEQMRKLLWDNPARLYAIS
ncbi:MAG: amidohydrolase [Dehalococcoidia bacterium]|nr:amidohydrolase [Dehalococcoidia bacterium]